nr:DUF4231 domain-containing protein [Flavobacterium sp. ASV13]
MTTFRKIISSKLEGYKKNVDLVNLDELQKNSLKHDWLSHIILMEYLTKKHYIIYNILNLTIIIAGTTIPVLINLDTNNSYLKYLCTLLAILVSIFSAINQFARPNERWRHFRLISEELKIEGEKFFALTEKYSAYSSHSEAYKLFMQNIEETKEKQIDIYLRKIARSETKKETPDNDKNTN